MASSRRPRRVKGVPTEFSLRSAEFHLAFHGACTTTSLRLRGALGVRTALPRRSSTALTTCRQNRNKVSPISSPARSAQSYCCHLGRPRLRFFTLYVRVRVTLSVKVFRSLYLLNMKMYQVDTLHIGRYWSEVLCSAIMTHPR